MKIKATQHETNLGQMRGLKMPTDSESIKILRRRKSKKKTK
jgi:hypothetical protein